MKTFVEELDIDETSKDASSVEVAIYLATVPKPGQAYVPGRSLSIVLDIPIHLISTLFFLKYLQCPNRP